MAPPLGIPDFIESYRFGKGIKNRQLLILIREVAAACFPIRGMAMLPGAAGPRLIHLLKSVEKNLKTEIWMK